MTWVLVGLAVIWGLALAGLILWVMLWPVRLAAWVVEEFWFKT